MKKPVLGVVLGALTLFVWGMISWMILPWHNSTMRKLPEEQLISDTLKTVVTEPGFYIFPHDINAAGQRDQKEWVEKHKKGPVGILAYSPFGKEPMGPINFIVEILAQLITAGLVMFVLNSCRERVASLGGRVFLTALLGLLIGVAVQIPYWNWFHFPLNFTVVAMADNIVSFALLGVVMSRFVLE